MDKRDSLTDEVNILLDLTVHESDYLPKILSTGKHENLNFFVMPLYGVSIAGIRKKEESNKFSLITSLMLGMQMLRAIREIHKFGYIHRDIKPGNFLFGTEKLGNARTLLIIDFGLSKKYLSPEGNLIPKADYARWVGSRRYMSINTHLRKDQGRRDDLISLLYVIVELHLGNLPWYHIKGLKNMDQVLEVKRAFDNEKLLEGFPEEFYQILNHIKTLKFSSEPDYDYIHKIMLKLFKKNGGSSRTRYDWEGENYIIDNRPFLNDNTESQTSSQQES